MDSDREPSSDDSDAGDAHPPAKKVDALDLFGDDISSEASDSDTEQRHQSKAQIDRDGEREDELEEEEDTAPTYIDLEMAKCRAELGSEGPLFVKFPNFLSVDTKPFDPETYEDENEDEDVLDEEGRNRLKLKVINE